MYTPTPTPATAVTTDVTTATDTAMVGQLDRSMVERVSALLLIPVNSGGEKAM